MGDALQAYILVWRRLRTLSYLSSSSHASRLAKILDQTNVSGMASSQQRHLQATQYANKWRGPLWSRFAFSLCRRVAENESRTSEQPIDEQELQDKYAWRQSFWRHGPILSVAALVLATACIFIALAVIKIPDGQPTAYWPKPVSFYLSITVTV